MVLTVNQWLVGFDSLARSQNLEVKNYRVWRSLVAQGVWDAKVAGSNPATRTKTDAGERNGLLVSLIS